LAGSAKGFRFYIETYGCSANVADSEKIKYQLQADGGQISPLDGTDVVIINSCGVKGPTENKILQKAEQLLSRGFPLIIAGCLPRIAKKRILKSCSGFAALVDTRSLHLISDTVSKVLAGERGLLVFSEEQKAVIKARMEVTKPSGTSGIVQISEGCNGQCAYCATKFARGSLHSFPVNAVVEAVKQLVNEHECREIWITAQDTGSYCSEGVMLPELLNKVLESVNEANYSIRIGMMNPESLKYILDDHANLLAREQRIYSFLHLPVQSGSDEILREMRRPYDVDTVKETVTVMKKNVPWLTLATDIIAGFPGETEENFEKSLQIIDWMKPDIVNISRFWPRKGTEAAKMPQIPHAIVKARVLRLVERTRAISLERNGNWIGWEGEALVTEKGKGNSMVLRNRSYKPIIVKEPISLGETLPVKIIDTTPFYLIGEVADS